MKSDPGVKNSELIFSACYFLDFSQSLKHGLAVNHHIHIWQVSMQLSCDDNCQMSMLYREYKKKSEMSPMGKWTNMALDDYPYLGLVLLTLS